MKVQITIAFSCDIEKVNKIYSDVLELMKKESDAKVLKQASLNMKCSDCKTDEIGFDISAMAREVAGSIAGALKKFTLASSDDIQPKP